MGLFDSAAVKQLKQEAGFIGGLVVQQAVGELPPDAADEVIHGESSCASLRKAFDAVVAELGDDKAIKKALGAAEDQARMFAGVRRVPPGDLPQIARDAIRTMLLSTMAP